MRYDRPIIAKAARIAVLALLFLAVGCQQQETSKEWEPIIDGYVEAWNTGNLDILDGIIAPQFVRIVGSTTSAEGLDSLKKYISSFRETYPDFHVTIDERIYAGDKSASRWLFTGTHSGLGNPPLKGKQVNLTGMSFSRMKNGKMVEERVEIDRLAWMLQLGYTLTPPSSTEE